MSLLGGIMFCSYWTIVVISYERDVLLAVLREFRQTYLSDLLDMMGSIMDVILLPDMLIFESFTNIHVHIIVSDFVSWRMLLFVTS